MLLLKLTDALKRARVAYALVGGYAVALHGAICGTMDVDLILRLEEQQFVAAERALKTIDLVPRLPVSALEVFRFRAEYISNRNLTAWSFVNPASPSELVDVILTHDLNEIQTIIKKVQGRSIRVASIDDLIKMKKQSGRPQDKEDVRALTKLRGTK